MYVCMYVAIHLYGTYISCLYCYCRMRYKHGMENSLPLMNMERYVAVYANNLVHMCTYVYILRILHPVIITINTIKFTSAKQMVITLLECSVMQSLILYSLIAGLRHSMYNHRLMKCKSYS